AHDAVLTPGGFYISQIVYRIARFVSYSHLPPQQSDPARPRRTPGFLSAEPNLSQWRSRHPRLAIALPLFNVLVICASGRGCPGWQRELLCCSSALSCSRCEGVDIFNSGCAPKSGRRWWPDWSRSHPNSLRKDIANEGPTLTISHQPQHVELQVAEPSEQSQ